MKKIFLVCVSLMTVAICSTSCLKSGLDELDTYSDTKITAVNFEHRWMIPINPADPWAGEKMQVKRLTVTTSITDGRIECTVTVPAASGTFTAEERGKVTMSNIAAYMTISPGATIRPNGPSPVLGTRGDYSGTLNYTVIAANGKEQNWEIVVTAFNK